MPRAFLPRATRNGHAGWLLAIFLVLAAILVTDRQVAAQANGNGEAPAAVDEGEDQPANVDLATASKGGLSQKTYLEWALGALGWTYSIVFLALSFILVALIVMNIVAARRENVCPTDLVEGFEKHLNERKYQDAYELARSDESFLGKVLAAGLAKLSAGYSPALEAMQEVGEEETMKLEHRISYIHLIGTISPMIGLLGTVHGMVISFRLLSEPGVSPKPWELAEGISTALVTTLVGLVIAIPAIGIYGILRNRISRLVLEVGILSEGLMSRFQSLGSSQKA